MINVTKSFLPPIKKYQSQLKRVWENQWLTNRGPLVKELEDKLKGYLEINNILITNNGTLPLQISLKLLANCGDVITTPFSYIATSSSILWENCKPIFVDIDPEYLTIDENKIERAITKRTTCILATHVYGNPCNVNQIERIAKKNNLKVIYDAAHCFGVRYKNKSIFKYGDISTCSFHATKIFHTGEGGAIFSSDKELEKKIFYSHNFGHDGPVDFFGLGINGKISELQAALGLSIFPYLTKIISERKKIVDYYNKFLNPNIERLKIRKDTEWNFSYYPIFFESQSILLNVMEQLLKNQIVPRRYFYPSLNTISFFDGKNMPISEEISSRVLCLPLYVGLKKPDLKKICSIINKNF